MIKMMKIRDCTRMKKNAGKFPLFYSSTHFPLHSPTFLHLHLCFYLPAALKILPKASFPLYILPSFLVKNSTDFDSRFEYLLHRGLVSGLWFCSLSSLDSDSPVLSTLTLSTYFLYVDIFPLSVHFFSDSTTGLLFFFKD